jgi:hypothetical protein
MQIPHRLVNFARKPPREQLRVLRAKARYKFFEWGWKTPQLGSDRTTYVIGLLGSGRWYVNELILKNFGERARYFRDELHFKIHPRATSLIYSGHATIKYNACGLQVPEVTSRILEAVGYRTADIIFVYRHPLDSLLTNWVWWRALFNEKKCYAGISQIYKNAVDLYTDLEENFAEFKSFADGRPLYFWANSGPPFLSFAEFVEETELYLQVATLRLRLEDFMADPAKEFSKMAELMSINVERSRLRIDPPKSKPYGYLAVQEKVPRFRTFINELGSETKRRIERIGYSLNV